ncbi:MAG: histidine phosphatase family protein [Defluviitaleaceae bacterium]|nr:histidine phosphatase family protein [Defluviitaleaceae bacterium]
MRITTIRHGETDWNRERKPQGSRDIELNQTGIQQAEKLAARLANEPCDIIYTSDLLRARKTAEIINSRHNVEMITSPLLRESSFGEFEGKSINDAKTLAAFNKFLEARTPAYFAQVQGYLKEIIACGKENIFIVGHHGTMRAIICGLLELPITDKKRFAIGNTAIHMFKQRDDGTFGIVLENDTSHL